MTRRGLLEQSDRLTAKQYAAIGRIAALWSEVEWAMNRILVRLALSASLLGYILIDKLGPDNRIKAIYGLIAVHRIKCSGLIDVALLTEIEEYLPALSAMKDDRNYIVHSVWSQSDETHLSHYDISATARSGIDISVGFPHPLEAIEEFGNQVEEAAILPWELGSRLPMLDATLLEKFHELERESRRPGARKIREVPPKSFARLQRKARPQPKPRKKAKRA